MVERLNKLETNVVELRKFKEEYQLKQLTDNIHLQWTLRYGLFESIQIVIDIACHLTAKYNLGNPETYADCIKLLNKEGYLSNELHDKLQSMIGLRNILIHEPARPKGGYVQIDLKELYDLLNELEDFSLFAKEIKDVI